MNDSRLQHSAANCNSGPGVCSPGPLFMGPFGSSSRANGGRGTQARRDRPTDQNWVYLQEIKWAKATDSGNVLLGFQGGGVMVLPLRDLRVSDTGAWVRA